MLPVLQLMQSVLAYCKRDCRWLSQEFRRYPSPGGYQQDLRTQEICASVEATLKSETFKTTNTPPWVLVPVVCWMMFFLYVWFSTPLQSPELKRSDLWLMLADTVLGVEDSQGEIETLAIKTGIQFLPQRLRLFGWALIVLCLSACHGLCVVRRLRIGILLSPTEQIVLIGGVGLAIQSIITLLAGLAGSLNTTAVCIPAAMSLLGALSCDGAKSSESEIALSRKNPGRSSALLAIVVLFVIVPFAVYLLMGSVSPPTDFDVREYHLQGPKEWFLQGRITYLRHNVYTSFPFLSEMLPLSAMVLVGDWWEGALVGQVVLACFQLLSACAVFSICSRWIDRSVAWLAALIYLTTPWTLRISLIPYAEGALAFYLICSFMVALLLIDPASHRRNASFLLGLLSGCGMASKYTGLVSVVIPCLVMIAFTLLLRSKELSSGNDSEVSWRQRCQSLSSPYCCFALGVILMIAPWLLRNLHDTGNPVYPLGYSVFGGSEWSYEMNARWVPAHSSREHRVELLPKHFMDVAVYNMWTSSLLFALAIPAMLLFRRMLVLRVSLVLLAWGFATWWALTHRIDRFWIPLIPLLSIVAACSWLLHSGRMWRGLLSVIIAAATSYNIYFCTLSLVGFHVGLMDLVEAKDLTVRSDIRLLNATLPPTAKVLMIGDAEVFDATFPLVYNTVFDDNIFEEWTVDPSDGSTPLPRRKMLPAGRIRSVLKSHGITHVFVHWGEILRYRLPDSYDYTGYLQPYRFDTLVSSGVLKSPRALLERPWSSLSEVEQQTIDSWIGYESLVRNDMISIVQLYELAE